MFFQTLIDSIRRRIDTLPPDTEEFTFRDNDPRCDLDLEDPVPPLAQMTGRYPSLDE